MYRKMLSIVLISFIFSHYSYSDQKNKASSTKVLTVNTLELQQQHSYTEKRVFIGQAEARQTTDTSFEVAGKLKAIYVDEGDVVNQGDRLATLDTDRLEAQYAEAKASLTESKANLNLARSTLKRVKAATKIRAASSQELDEAEQTLNAAIASVNRQNAVLQRIDIDLKKSTLTAPFAALITTRIADNGQVIAVGRPVLRLQEHGSLEARVALANGLADQLKLNTTVRLSNEKYPNISATVKAILPLRDERTRTVDVIFNLPDDLIFRPGDLIEFTMEQQRQQSGFWIPLSALSENIRGLWSVFVIKKNVAQRKVVDIIYIDSDTAYVRGNLSDRERIIANGIHRVIPGQAVTPAQ